MVLALVVSLLSGQVIYEWIDSSGDSHFTDDVNTIPAKAKRRITSGVEPVVSVPRAEPRTTADAGVVKLDAGQVRPDAGVAPVTPGPSGPDSCEAARRRIQELEQQAQREQLAFKQQQDAEDQQCRTALNTSGQAAYARCMAGRSQRPPPSNVDQQMEQARDALRHAQIEGCR